MRRVLMRRPPRGTGWRPRAQGRQPVPRGCRRMSTLLIEIGCEELPYKVCESVVRQLEDTAAAPGLVHKLLEAERLLESGAPDLRVLVSPRRTPSTSTAMRRGET